MCHKSGAKVMVKKWDCQGVAFFRGENKRFTLLVRTIFNAKKESKNGLILRSPFFVVKN